MTVTNREEELLGMLAAERQSVRDAVAGLSRCASAINELKAENQRLREALEHLATFDGLGVCDRLCQDYARNALEARKGAA